MKKKIKSKKRAYLVRSVLCDLKDANNEDIVGCVGASEYTRMDVLLQN